MQAATRRWRARNRDKVARGGKAWREANREHYLEKLRNRKVDPVKNRNRAKAWRDANTERARGREAEWKRNNPEKVRAMGHKRRSILRGARQSPGVTPEQWREILDDFSGLCAYCGAQATTRDHVLAVSRGGLDAPDNVVPACRRCNFSKGAKTLEEWLHFSVCRHDDYLTRFSRMRDSRKAA